MTTMLILPWLLSASAAKHTLVVTRIHQKKKLRRYGINKVNYLAVSTYAYNTNFVFPLNIFRYDKKEKRKCLMGPEVRLIHPRTLETEMGCECPEGDNKH